MKPIRLEFAGLHSYREAQIINFEKLLGGGVFGIFGPTGSGKSTILDAVTLALYGKVARAKNNTQGILNHAEPRLWVKFTFALTGAGGREHRYRVERSYQRHEGASVRIAHCRLVEETAKGETVLADREREVTQTVQEILGLTAEEFTRAVVLPQGKFAEFLHLDGQQRRKMLQHLFDLTRYGDELAERLKARLQAVDQRLEVVTGTQQGLGDASADAVKAARERVRRAVAILEQAKRDLKQREAEHKELERLWQLQQDLEQVERELALWRQRDAGVQALREELALSNRAEPVRRYLEEVAAGREAVEEASALLEGAAARLREAQEQEALAAAAHQAAHQRLREEQPRLLQRQQQLREAVEVASQVKTMARQVRQIRAERDRAGQRAKEVEATLKARQQELEALKGRLAETLGRLAELAVPPDHRQRVERAGQALALLREAEKGLARSQKRLQRAETDFRRSREVAAKAAGEAQEAATRLSELEQVLARLEADPPANEADLAFEVDWLARAETAVREVLRREEVVRGAQRLLEDTRRVAMERAQALEEQQRAEADAQQALVEARGHEEKAQTALEEARRQHQAAELAALLRAGQPCPVCGSPHHPAPAAGPGRDAISLAEAALAEARSTRKAAEARLEQVSKRTAEVRARAERAAADQEARQHAVNQAEADLAGARERLPEPWRDLPPERLPSALASERKAHEDRQGNLTRWRQQVETMRRQREDLVRQAHAVAVREARAQESLQAAEREEQAAREELRQWQATVEERRAALAEVAGDLTPEGVEAEARRIAAADRQAADLQRHLQQMREQQGHLEEDLQRLQRQLQQVTAEHQALAVKEAEAARGLAVLEARLRDLAGPEPPERQLATVEEELRSLETLEAQAAREAQQARETLLTARSAEAAARRQKEIAEGRLNKGLDSLEQALARAGFATPDEAAAALRPDVRRAELDQIIRAHEQEGHRLEMQRRELVAELGGRGVAAGEWEEHQRRLDEARNARDTAFREHATAEQALQDVEARHCQWQELERERQELSSRRALLEQLQDLLRGGAFVDFLAQQQLRQVATAASARLATITRYRYALEVDGDGGFVIRDDYNGGVRRPVHTLSGGETFLASLALALALSAQVQLRGRYPLEFFFLDEGFGTLDPDLLNLVVETLERLQLERLQVGVISHVPELRQRLARRLVVESAEPGGRGSRVRLEIA